VVHEVLDGMKLGGLAVEVVLAGHFNVPQLAEVEIPLSLQGVEHDS